MTRPKKIGIYGGSFNPIHNGHLQAIDKILRNSLVDQIWILPTGSHAFDKQLAQPQHRLAMIRLALKESGFNKNVVGIECGELYSSKKSYTAQTIRRLRKEHEHDFIFIAGSDVLYDIERWHDFEYISKAVPFIVIKRKNDHINRNSGVMLEKIIFNDPSDISSSRIRENISDGISISGLLPESVERYIRRNNLYNASMNFQNAASAADLIVPYNGGLLFVKRKNNPFKGYWAFPGGYLNSGKESLKQAAVRELREETGLKAKISDLELIEEYSNPARDPRGHVISHAYLVTSYSGKLCAADDAEKVKVFMEKPSDLAFDHSKIYDDAIKYTHLKKGMNNNKT